MRAIVFDTEVNSMEHMEPIEVAWCEFSEGEVSEMHVKRFMPEHPIDPGAAIVHGILMHDLEGEEPSSEAASFLPSADYVIGHNVDFDCEVIDVLGAKRICTLALAQSVWPTFKCHRLGALMYEVFGMTDAIRTRLKESHEAGADVAMCRDLLSRLADDLAIHDLDELWAESEEARIPKVMRFGKHKGELISAIPSGYKTWMLKQNDIDPYLRKALTR